MNLNAEQICNACMGQFLVEPKDTTVFAMAAKIDSRQINCGDMFVAMQGENVDGHNFIKDVIEKRASIVIVEKDIDEKILKLARESYVCVIKVKNSEKALADIAIEWRKNVIGKVIGITGSVGKTTTKKLVYEVLCNKYQVTANEGNYNNELGLPITLCSSNFEDDYLVTEMGMSAMGEIEYLCNIAQPEWGIITNIGEAHIEFLGSKENIAKAKAELPLAIPNNIGKIFLPTDDEYTNFIIQYAKLEERNIEIIRYGGCEFHDEIKTPQLWYEDVQYDEKGHPSFYVCIRGFWNSEIEKQKCYLNLAGKHNISNACAAIAIALRADISLTKAIETLKNTTPEDGRQEVIKAHDGYSIINDAYNANPQSMISSIETFATISTMGKRIAFLGDMLELGEYEIEAHEKVGEIVVENNIDELICVGPLSKYIFEAAIKSGMKTDCAKHFENNEDALIYLKKIAKPKDLILFKASNSMGFQKIAKDLMG